ncbi:helix-turn-helix domain-containing protein [Kitasatospora sp. CM 4170]|uniref:DUF6597 domain-containing transcriptional factor n=1 Tax=Kitasatospora aburaviensis TaxID=67265 RepID=A0ABW1F356_9ACTN|nr:helix-turn-helix domain-containing protein [Kitasatospora sp. CM 4170]WNM47230.1 helix-turn-helix domain-containing protein [Kitasatospora sp. CM 4170]
MSSLGPGPRSPEPPAFGRGVLHPGLAAGVLGLERHGPAPGLARSVDYYWLVHWDRRGLPPYEQKVLSHPNVHLVFEEPGARVHGVDRSLFVRRLEGAGHALGVRFRPGGFRAFTGRPVAELADRSLPAADFFGPEADRLNERVRRAGPDAAALTAAVDAFLLARLPAPDPAVERQAGTAAAVVRRIADGPDLHRVDRLAAEFGLTVRQLQRLFAEYVGAPPKWVLRRARLHEAAERADRGATVDWAALAADLGYADQAHFTRDFTAAVGMPPARYAGGGPPGPA